MTRQKDIADILNQVQYSLQHLARCGWTGFDCSPESLIVMNQWGRPPVPHQETLEAIQADIGDCKRCKLCRSRTHIVFGSGNSNARLMFVGEGPGYDEDQQGEPFVGAAGQLLTRIIQAIRMNREDVYICNIVKCRPPGNRVPEPDEVRTCLPFLERQIAVVAPEMICALGATAARTLLDTNAPISRLRGRVHDFNGTKLLPTYHPAYLLRNPEKKRDVWEDMKLLMREMGIELP
jgi:DNA polymerase